MCYTGIKRGFHLLYDPAFTRTGSRLCVQGITDHQNMRGAHVELYGSPITLIMNLAYPSHK